MRPRFNLTDPEDVQVMDKLQLEKKISKRIDAMKKLKEQILHRYHRVSYVIKQVECTTEEKNDWSMENKNLSLSCIDEEKTMD